MPTLPRTYDLNITLTGGNDTRLIVENVTARVDGRDGSDTITVAAAALGSDLLIGANGNDLLVAGAADDILDGGAGTDTLDGGAGNDVLRGGAGADSLVGGDGENVADYAASAGGVTISLNANPTRVTRGVGGDATGDVLLGIAHVIGSGANDLLSGNGLANRFVGGLGIDTLRGLAGNDTLIGDRIVDQDENGVPDDDDGDGLPDGVNTDTAGGADLLDGGADNDLMMGGGGNDTLLGGAGNDTSYGGFGDDLISTGDGDDLADGGEGGDTLLGSLGGDTLRGAGGNDELNASLGNDLLEGGDGEDGLLGGDGLDSLLGGNGHDRMDAGSGNDMLDGGEGDDTLIGGTGADLMEGGAGRDTADYSTSAPVIVNLGDAASNQGGALGDTLSGIEDLVGSGGGDALIGDTGDNRLVGGAGADTLIGQSGLDTADYTASAAAVTVVLGATVADPTLAGTGLGGDAEGDVLILIERLIGSAFNDSLTGGELADTLIGGAGADSLDGGLGFDTADYSASTAAVSVALADGVAGTGLGGDAEGDSLLSLEGVVGSAFGDLLTGNAQANRLDGAAGDDTLRGGMGADTMLGGDGTDIVDYSLAVGAVVARIGAQISGQGGESDGDAIASTVEVLRGSAFADQLFGNTGANLIEGGDSADVLGGDAGDDTLVGGAGADTFDGGAGIDWVDYSSAPGAVVAAIGGQFTGQGGVSDGDGLVGTVENLRGSAFSDQLFGNAAANALEGGAGNDLLRGGVGTDTLNGGAGVDTASYSTATAGVVVSLSTGGGTGGEAVGDVLIEIENLTGSGLNDQLVGNAASNQLTGLAGSDILVGLGGSDLLTGGTNADLFLYTAFADSTAAAPDLIAAQGPTGLVADFVQGLDRIDVSLIDANGIAADGNQAFAWRGVDAFLGGGVASARYTVVSGTGVEVQFDVGNGGSAEMVVRVVGLASLQQADFVL